MERKSNIPPGERGKKAPEATERALVPDTSQDLIDTTLSPGDGALSRLQDQFAWIGIEDPSDRERGIDADMRRTIASRIQEFVMELDQRIRGYLIQESEQDGAKKSTPTIYAELLAKTLQNPGATTPTARRGLAELSSTVIAEINPILRDLHAYIQEHVTPLLSEMDTMQSLGSQAGFLNFFKYGKGNSKDRYSLFGALDFFGSHIKGFPTIDLKEKTFPNSLVVQDPLASDTDAYWKEKRRFYKQTYDIDMSRPALIAHRSSSAAYVLAEQQVIRLEKEVEELQKKVDVIQKPLPDEGASSHDRESELAQLHADIEQIKILQQRYYDLATWVRERADEMRDVSEARLADHVSSLTFAWGDPEEIFTVLNALEAVKHHNPELYARLLGIQESVSSKESVHSDLYGNVLHIAFARSLHHVQFSTQPENVVFRARMKALQTLDARSTPLVYVSQKQWSFLEKTLAPGVEGTKAKQGDIVARALMLVGISPESYLLRKMFESPDVVEREKVMALLTTATPDEFIRLIKRITKKDSAVPEDIKHVFDERGIANLQLTQFKGRQADSSDTHHVPATPQEILRAIHDANPTARQTSEAYKLSVHIVDTLWRTTPSERLLEGNEFSGYLERRSDELAKGDKRIEKLGKNDSPLKGFVEQRKIDDPLDEKIANFAVPVQQYIGERNQQKEISRSLLAIFNAHPDITQDQWIQWWKRMSTSVETVTLISGKRSIHGSGETVSTSQRTVNIEARIKAMKALFRHFTPQQVVQSRSQAFVLFNELFPFPNQGDDWRGRDLWNIGKPSLQHFFSEENLKEFKDNDIDTEALKYKVLYRVIPQKIFFSRRYIDKHFYAVDLQDITANMDPSMRKRFLADLVQCLVNETPIRDITDVSIEWMKDLLTMAEETIPEDSQYRTLSGYDQDLRRGTVITNNLTRLMHFGASSGYWDVKEIGERILSGGRVEIMLEAKILRKIDGTWQIMTTDKLRMQH